MKRYGTERYGNSIDSTTVDRVEATLRGLEYVSSHRGAIRTVNHSNDFYHGFSYTWIERFEFSTSSENVRSRLYIATRPTARCYNRAKQNGII